MGGKWLVHGRQIGARDIETIISLHFRDLREFVNLCNSVSWAEEGSGGTSVPSFTERYEVADGGIDAEWIAFEVPGMNRVPRSLIVNGWNVYQYKQRDILAAGRDECFRSLKSSVSGAVQSIYERTRKRPQGFVLFTNIDLTHDTQAEDKKGRKLQAWKMELCKAVLTNYDEPKSVKVSIVGAAELAAMLNNLPHLRSAYFCRSEFISWDEAWQEHTHRAFLESTVPLTGRAHDLKSLQWALENPGVRVIAVSGPDYIGKTRLVLEATKSRSMDTVVARNPRSVTPGDLSDLLADHHLTVVVVPEYEPGKSEDIISYAITQRSLKLVVEVSSAEDLVLPWFGHDERVLDFRLGALSSADSTALLKAAEAKFKSGVEAWVLDQASGNPGLLLMAAHSTSELTSRAVSFSNTIADSMKKIIRRDLDADHLEILRFLSLFDPILLHENEARSMRVIAGTLGIQEDRLRRIQDDITIYKERGLIRGGERFAVVEPCLLANRLASEIIERAANPFWDAFMHLPPDVQLSLLRRLRQVSGKQIDTFWSRLFGPEGPFGELDFSAGQLEVLLSVAAHVPVTVATKILTELESMNPNMRRSRIQGIRIQLIWLMEYLLIRPEVAETALRCIVLLAEVDNTPENHHPNARADFKELFHPLHLQVAVPLQKRHTLLAEYVKRSSRDWLRLLALEAIQTALGHRIVYSRHAIPGPVPASRSDFIQFSEVFLYQDQLYDLLMQIAQSEDTIMSQAACNSIPEVTAEMAFAGRGQEAIRRFSGVLDSALRNELAVSPAALGGELERVRGHFREQQKETTDKADHQLLDQWIKEINRLVERLEEIKDFEFRLRRWAGPWTFADRKRKSGDTAGVLQLRCDTELRKLAGELSSSPDLLTEDLLKWLSSKDAQKASKFFWFLGIADAERKLLPIVEETGRSEVGVTAFSSYFGGWGQTDRKSSAEALHRINQKKQVHYKARMFATICLGPASGGIDHLTQLLAEPEIEAFIREDPILLAPWSDELSPEDRLRLLQLIAGQPLDNPMKALEFLSQMSFSDGGMEGPLLDIVEQCLLAAQPDLGDDYACDHVASKLVHQDPERGFGLLEKLLGPNRRSYLWNPIDRHSQGQFWNALCSTDRRRAIGVLLKATQNDPAHAWNAREMLNQVEDEAILVSFAAENEEMAVTVCECITAGRPGFWPIAMQIVSQYPESGRIRTTLSIDQIFRRPLIGGPLWVYFDEKRIEVERLLADSTTTGEARSWLRELVSELRQLVKKHRTIETDQEVT